MKGGFTRNHATTSPVRDKGGIAPNDATYDSTVSLAGEALSFWPSGARWNAAIDLGPVHAQRSAFHAVRMLGTGNQIHATVEKDGVVMHNIRMFRGANNAAQINFDGQLLTPSSPTDRLEIARAVALAAANA